MAFGELCKRTLIGDQQAAPRREREMWRNGADRARWPRTQKQVARLRAGLGLTGTSLSSQHGTWPQGIRPQGSSFRLRRGRACACDLAFGRAGRNAGGNRAPVSSTASRACNRGDAFLALSHDCWTHRGSWWLSRSVGRAASTPGDQPLRWWSLPLLGATWYRRSSRSTTGAEGEGALGGRLRQRRLAA